ncbi:MULTISPECIES: hypothetical protein [unclassified Streptomyces]|nr:MULTISPECIES: hypothetical protein [unclassified Streptomyces]
MFTIEMAYARMRELQAEANRSRVHPSVTAEARAAKKHAARAKKR